VNSVMHFAFSRACITQGNIYIVLKPKIL